MTLDGSTARTIRERGSYEPVPAPTLRMLLQPVSARSIAAPTRGSLCRVPAYVCPISSYSAATEGWWAGPLSDLDPASADTIQDLHNDKPLTRGSDNSNRPRGL